MDVLLVEGFAEGLVLPHANRSELPPNVMSCVTIVKGVEMVPSSMPEQTGDLIEFRGGGYDEDGNEERFDHGNIYCL